MTLDMSNPLDVLYLETLPQRPTAADPVRMEFGPTAQFRKLEAEREKWELLLLFAVDDDPAVGAA